MVAGQDPGDCVWKVGNVSEVFEERHDRPSGVVVEGALKLLELGCDEAVRSPDQRPQPPHPRRSFSSSPSARSTARGSQRTPGPSGISPIRGCCGLAAASTVARKRAIFYNAVEYAVELGHLSGNPVASIKWRAPKVTEAVNPRVVINHGQARTLLDAVRAQEPVGARLVAFFGVMYYAALRPGEAVDLRKDALSLPGLLSAECRSTRDRPAPGPAGMNPHRKEITAPSL